MSRGRCKMGYSVQDKDTKYTEFKGDIMGADEEAILEQMNNLQDLVALNPKLEICWYDFHPGDRVKSPVMVEKAKERRVKWDRIRNRPTFKPITDHREEYGIVKT